MFHLSFRLVFVTSLFCTLLGCTANQEHTNPFLGTWTNHETGGNQTLIFQKNNQGLWIFHKARGMDTLSMQYHYDLEAQPHKLDLTGFTRGNFLGLGIFGIVTFEGPDLMKYDCEAAEANEPGDQIRPKTFDLKKTHRYRKVQ